MPYLKDIKRRIGVGQKDPTDYVCDETRLGAKLRRATTRPRYLHVLLGQDARCFGTCCDHSWCRCDQSIAFRKRKRHQDLLVVVTSDRGLCGGFNSALLRKTEDFIAKAKDGISCDILVYGRKGKDYLSARKYDLTKPFWTAKNNKMDLVRDLSDTVVHAYTNGEYGRIYLVSNEFVNVMIQNPQFQQVLPLSVDTSTRKNINWNTSMSRVQMKFWIHYYRFICVRCSSKAFWKPRPVNTPLG